MALRNSHIKLSKSSLKRLGITSMDDYLKGGLDPLNDEIKNNYVLDRNGGLREKLFGKYRTDPTQASNYQRPSEKAKSTKLYDTFPSFYFYNALKKEGFIKEEK